MLELVDRSPRLLYVRTYSRSIYFVFLPTAIHSFMDSLINNLSLLILPLPIAFVFVIYLSQHKDRIYLQKRPEIVPLPRTRYDLKLKELTRLKKKISKLSREEYRSRESEIYFLERKVNKVLIETEAEERNYHNAVSRAQGAWIDYKEVYLEIGFWLRSLSAKRGKELRLFRRIYLETKFRADNEKEKILARERIWLQEEKNQHQDNISKTKSEIEISEENLSTNIEQPSKIDSLVDINDASTGENLLRSTKPREKNPDRATNSFCLDQYHEMYPHFENLTFEGDLFSLEDQSISVIKDAIFDGAVFRAVRFIGVQQFQNCSFRGSDFSGSIFQKSEMPHRFLNCDFSDARFTDCAFEFAAFYNCSFRNINSENLMFKTIKFIDCSFEDCDLKDMDFSKTVMSRKMLASMDFSAILQKPKNWTRSTKNENSDTSRLS